MTKRRGPFGRSLAFDLSVLGAVALLVAGGLAAGYSVAYQNLYGPSAFVKSYLDLLGRGRAADALALPGVAVDASQLAEAGIPETASDALLRSTALAPLTDVAVVAAQAEGDDTVVTADYRAGGHAGHSSFRVTQDGWVGILPKWRFAVSPLSAIDLTVLGSMQFAVNGFEIDKRQVAPEGLDAAPGAPVSLLTFTPGLYAITVDTQIATSPGTAVLADVVASRVPVTVSPGPTQEFTKIVQDSVDDFLTKCATQQVLQPTGCPFGFSVNDRLADAPSWTIAQMPKAKVRLEGEEWAFPPAHGVAHVNVPVVSIYDGTTHEVSEDVAFVITGQITILADGRASIRVKGIDPL